MILSELIGKKVVIHVAQGTQVVLHRGVLESADTHFLKLKKDNELIYFCLYHVVGVTAV